MVKKTRVLLSASLIAVLAASGAQASASNLVPPAGPDSLLQQDVNKIRSIGTTGVAAEANDGTSRTMAQAGVFQVGQSWPVPPNPHVRIGSNTKTFISTVILQLEAEGKLNIEDPVSKYLPASVTNPNGINNGNDFSKITIHNLLQHTSGLFDYVSDPAMYNTILTADGFYANRSHTYSLQDLLNIALPHQPDFAPGAQFEYSNTNYIAAGLIIQSVTGHSWSTEVHSRIITPLGLVDTNDPGTSPYLPAPFVHGYEIFTSSGAPQDTTLDNMTWGGSAGSLYSTPHDDSLFFEALLTGKLLKQKQLTEMTTTIPMGDDYNAVWPNAQYGLGLIRTDLPCGDHYWHHGGDVIGYNMENGARVLPGGKVRSAAVSSATNTNADAAFASNSLTTTNKLVWDMLCGTDTVTSPAAAPYASRPRL